MVPRPLLHAVVILAAAALIPLALIARARVTTSARPRLHVVMDMGRQPKYKPQSEAPLFADGRAMRPAVAGTVARGELREDERFYRGREGDEWIKVLPLPLTAQLVRRGRERFDIYCAPCHGLAGYGDGAVAKRADALQEGTWTPPSSFHIDVVRQRPDGHIFNTISNGIRNMPAYGAQIPPADRWAIVAYVRALQRSQNARVDDVPRELRGALR
jgi:mono/diheme cytochrome c family protein